MLEYGLFCALLCLTAQLLAAREAFLGSRQQTLPRATSVWLGFAVWTLVVTCCVDATASSFEFLFWTSQIAMLVLFASSGCLLAGWLRRLEAQVSNRRPFRRWLESPLMFPAIAGALVLLPWAWMAWRDFGLGRGRNVGASFERTLDLALWGLGGELPQYLQPETVAGFARGLGWLPREVTVPMGVALIAAWLIVAFAMLVLVVSLGRGTRVLIHAATWAPFLTFVALVFWNEWFGSGFKAASPDAWFDSRYFLPLADSTSGIWRSSPGTLRSLGPMLLIAAAATIVVAVVVIRPRTRRQRPAEIESPRQHA